MELVYRKKRSKAKKIPFSSMFEAKLRDGTKTTTFRNKKMVDEGGSFTAYDMTFECIKVEKMNLSEVMEKHLATEGVASKEDFEFIWKKIHPRKKTDPNYVGYLHTFRKKEG